MSRIVRSACVCALVMAPVAWAGSGQPVEDMLEMNEPSGHDVLTELWNFEDAVPVAAGQVDLRLTGRWVTASFPANLGDSHDDAILTPSIRWGAWENLELSVTVPVVIGEGGALPDGQDGNYDTFVGMLWRMSEQEGLWPAMGLSGTVRLPTGENSSGVDGELRLVMTNEYKSGLRSHVNGFAQSVNGDAQRNLRDFQWGFIVGLDGPLCAGGAVRWVADYMHRSSFRDGSGDINQLEVGWEWDIAAANKLGMSVQIGLDDNDDTSDFGAAVTYAYALK